MWQLDGRHAVLHFGEIGPGVPAHITNGACQGQILQLCVAQISATQIQPDTVALAWIKIINRTAPLLMGCQQPLDIRPRKLHACKWVDALQNIWCVAATSVEFCLALGDNLWLRAPWLALFCPEHLPCLAILRLG